MLVRRIGFENFRNLEGEPVLFKEGMNVIRGQNAQGKSNILEGVYLFARGRSFRGAKSREMIRFGESAASVKLEFCGDSDRNPTELRMDLSVSGADRYFRRGAPLKGAREMIGAFRAVLFCPAHLSLAGGAPAVRRAYLDIALSQLSPVYITDLAAYRRLLVQRNTLLKEASGGKRVSDAEWESFGIMLARYGAAVASARLRYLTVAAPAVKRVFLEMTGGTEIPELSYESAYLRTASGEALLREAEKPIGSDVATEAVEGLIPLYTEHREREMRLGATLYGIHKDDIKVTLNGRDAGVYASQGQQRSIALAMKLAEGECSRRLTGEYPVFLLDDVLSELDFERRGYVLSALSGRQIIITSCDADLFGGTCDANIITVENGRVTEYADATQGEHYE